MKRMTLQTHAIRAASDPVKNSKRSIPCVTFKVHCSVTDRLQVTKHFFALCQPKVIVFWVVATCNLVETDGRFRGAIFTIRVIHHKMKAVSTSETSFSFHQTTWRNYPEDS
jgi:hypothetical protein